MEASTSSITCGSDSCRPLRRAEFASIMGPAMRTSAADFQLLEVDGDRFPWFWSLVGTPRQRPAQALTFLRIGFVGMELAEFRIKCFFPGAVKTTGIVKGGVHQQFEPLLPRLFKCVLFLKRILLRGGVECGSNFKNGTGGSADVAAGTGDGCWTRNVYGCHPRSERPYSDGRTHSPIFPTLDFMESCVLSHSWFRRMQRHAAVPLS